MSDIKATIYKGRAEKVGPSINIVRSLPNSRFNAIGSVVFVDHLIRQKQPAKSPEMPDGSFAHPHRGIATFTYILEGGVHHLDSNGGEGKVYNGGIQWMKAGNGIVHDEFQPYDLQESGSMIHGFQFWLNLPAASKKESPDYLAVQAEDVPEILLPKDSGVMRILLGNYEDKASDIPNFLDQYMGHINLKPGKTFNMSTHTGWEYGFYLVNGSLTLDEKVRLNPLEIADVSDFGNEILLTNTSNEAIDIIVFSGEPYTEPMVAYGPFVMNTEEEIKLAYSDFRKGKYGQIDYSKVKL